MRPAINTSAVKNPNWSGRDGEYAVVVSRGEPRRSDQQMLDVVSKQVTAYVALHSGRTEPQELVDLAIKLIAEDYIDKVGSQGVQLTREHVFAYLDAAKKRWDAAGAQA